MKTEEFKSALHWLYGAVCRTIFEKSTSVLMNSFKNQTFGQNPNTQTCDSILI